jgi:3-oxoacid CoA-transferase B subunit
MLVNLGIGIPTLVANFVPKDMHVFFQSENGLIGTGPIPEEGMAHPTLTDAGGRPVTALPGAQHLRQRDIVWSYPRRPPRPTRSSTTIGWRQDPG